LATISSGLCLFLDMDPSSFDSEAILQGGPLQRGRITDDFDRIASYNRILGYCAVRNVSDAKLAIVNSMPFMIAVPITKDWNRPKGGIIPLPLSASTVFRGNHAIEICGCDDTNRRFCFVNSWGSSWGDNGYGYLPYSYLRFYMIEAWIDLFGPQHREPSGSAQTPYGPKYTLYSTEIDNPIGYKSIIHVTFEESSSDKVAWCLLTARDGFLDVEDFLVKPSHDPVTHSHFLARALLTTKAQIGLPIRFWVPHCDLAPSSYNNLVISNVIAGLGLVLKPSPQRWAGAVAV